MAAPKNLETLHIEEHCVPCVHSPDGCGWVCLNSCQEAGPFVAAVPESMFKRGGRNWGDMIVSKKNVQYIRRFMLVSAMWQTVSHMDKTRVPPICLIAQRIPNGRGGVLGHLFWLVVLNNSPMARYEVAESNNDDNTRSESGTSERDAFGFEFDDDEKHLMISDMEIGDDKDDDEKSSSSSEDGRKKRGRKRKNASKEDGAEKAGKSAKTAGKRKFELTKAINTRHFLVNVFQHMSSIKVDRGKWRHSKVDDKYEHLHRFHPSYWNPLNPVVYVQTVPEEKLGTTAGLMWSDIMKQKIASPESICSTVPALTRFMDDLNMSNVDESMDEVLPFLLNEKYQCHDGHVRLPLNYCAQICVNNQTSFFDDWSHTPRGVFVFTEKHDEVDDDDEFMTDDEDEREIESLVKRGVSRVNAKKFVEKRREYKSDDRYRALIRKQTMAPNDTTMDVDSMNVSTASLKELTEMEESYFMSPHSNPANRYGMAEIRSRMIHEIRKPIAGGWGSRTLKLPYVAGMSLLSSLVAVLDHGLLVHCRCISPEHYWLMAMLSNPIKPTPLHFVGPSGSGKSRIVEVLINTLKMSWCELRVSASNDTLDLKSGGIHCCIMYDDTNMFKGRANVMLEEGESTHERTKMGDKKERIEQILNVIRNVAVFTNLLNAVINGDTPYNGTTLKRFVNFSVLEIKVPFSLSFRVDKASIEARNMFCEEVRNVVVAGSNVQRMVSCGMREVTDVLDLILAAVQNDSAIFDDKRRLGCARKLARVLAAHEFAYGTSAARTGGNTVHAWSPKSIARETVIVTAEAAIMGIALVAGDDYWSERMCMHALLQYVLKVKSKWFFGADEWLPSTVPREVVPGSEDGSLTFGLSERTMQLARMRNEESSSSKKKKKKKTQETKKDITDQNRMRGKMEAIPGSDDEREDKKDDGAGAADGAVDPNSTSGDNQVETYKQLIDMYDEMQARNPTMFAKRERFELPIRLSACHDPIKALVNSILSKVAFAEASILRDAFTVHLKSKSGPNGKIRIVGHVMFVPFWMFGYERPKKHRRVYTRLAACLRPDRIYVLPHSGRDGPDFTENLDPRLPATFCPRTELESLKRRNQKAYVRLVKKNQDLERSVDKHVRGDVSESTANEILKFEDGTERPLYEKIERFLAYKRKPGSITMFGADHSVSLSDLFDDPERCFRNSGHDVISFEQITRSILRA